jgi:hypothetical protein
VSATLTNASALLTCRYCRRRRAVRPRGLCAACYYTPGVRELFPSTSKFARRGRGPGNGGYALPEQPTRIPPGPLKVPVLEERARLGVSLWHPLDAR